MKQKRIVSLLMSAVMLGSLVTPAFAFDDELFNSKVFQEQNIDTGHKNINKSESSMEVPNSQFDGKSDFSAGNGDFSFAMQYENAKQGMNMGFNSNKALVGSSSDCLSLFSSTYGDIDKAEMKEFELPDGWNSKSMIEDMGSSIVSSYKTGLSSPEVKSLMSQINVGGTMAQISAGKNQMANNSGPQSFASLNGQIDTASLKGRAAGTLWSNPMIEKEKKSHDVGTMDNPNGTSVIRDNPFSTTNKIGKKIKNLIDKSIDNSGKKTNMMGRFRNWLSS